MKKINNVPLENIFKEAHLAGMVEAQNHTPTPMVVGEETFPFSGKINYSRPTYVVTGGVCGFAYVTIKPGNSAAAKYAKDHYGAFPRYHGGVQFSVHQFGQSLELKEKYAAAFAGTLVKYGIKAWMESRMD